MPCAHVLAVDDDPELLAFVSATLSARGHVVDAVPDATTALGRLESAADYDVLLTDVRMPSMDGLELCRRVTAANRSLPVVIMTAHASTESAISALRARAFDLIPKPFSAEELLRVVEAATDEGSVAEDDGSAPSAAHERRALADLWGESEALDVLDDLVARIAVVDTTVLVVGESGTGKELIARALHRESRRAEHPFVAVNCAAISEQLLESELFGHVRGAFTGAHTSHRGLFEQAKGGTLFLDEVGELPLSLQPKLLRALQERALRPVGSEHVIEIDVRVVAATNRRLQQLVAEGRFREDLYYRLAVIEVEVPPLRDRGDDSVLCARRFVTRFAGEMGKEPLGLSPEAEQRVRDYPWPGNVRELENAMQRAVALCRGDLIRERDLPAALRCRAAAPADRGDDALLPLAEIERRHIAHVLDAVRGNKSAAARILGIDRRTLYRKPTKPDAK